MLKYIFLIHCVIFNVHAVPRRLHANDAVKTQFPFHVFIRQCDDGCFHDCGGAILNERWILTAAHCTGSMDLFERYIIAGTSNLRDSDGSVQTIGIDDYIIHPSFDDEIEISPHDIALWKLNSSLVFNDFVQPIQLPEKDSDVNGIATISGWELTDEDQTELTDDIFAVHLPIVSYRDCQDALSSIRPAWRDFLDENANICTVPISGESSCYGDSGGPLTQNGVVIGVVSWGVKPCSYVEAPTVYTRISSYVDWIKENIETIE